MRLLPQHTRSAGAVLSRIPERLDATRALRENADRHCEDMPVPDSHLELERQNAALTRQLLQWIRSERRTYADALDVWRSSCPRHTIWEDALAAGFIDCGTTRESVLALTQEGERFLAGTS